MLLYGRKQVGYGTIKERDLEGSICAMPFNSSLTVSIKARFLSRILSAMLIRKFFMLFFTLIINCMPPKKRLSNSFFPIYPLFSNKYFILLSRVHVDIPALLEIFLTIIGDNNVVAKTISQRFPVNGL